MDKAGFHEYLGPRAGTADFPALDRFVAALYVYNESKNLTRIAAGDVWLLHIADSLLFEDLIPIGAHVADIGTGPGFPAWPLAWLRPDITVEAIDSNGKMLEFLRTVPLPNLKVRQVRVEEDLSLRERFDFVTGRALAPLSIQVEVSAALAKIGGMVAPMRVAGEDFELRELGQLSLHLETVVERTLGSMRRASPLYRKHASTQDRFPRRWSDIKKRPLK